MRASFAANRITRWNAGRVRITKTRKRLLNRAAGENLCINLHATNDRLGYRATICPLSFCAKRRSESYSRKGPGRIANQLTSTIAPKVL
jgi:hypothetical protein